MATINSSTECKKYLDQLAEAINKKDKKAILEVYGVFSEYDFDWALYSKHYANKYDTLVDKGNDILYA